MPKQKKQKTSKIDETKVELAKAIAEQSKKLTKSYMNIGGYFLKAFRWFSNWFDRLLFNQRFSKEIALLLAILLYVSVNSSDSLNNVANTTSYSKEFQDIALTVEVNDSVYEVTGLPETVDVTLTGDLSDISLATAEKQTIVADLTGLTEGTHTVELQAMGLSGNTKALIVPNQVTVTISKKISMEFSVGYQFINTNKMDKIYSLGVPKFEKDTVIIRASQETIDKISVVNALIDVSNVSGDIVAQAPLVAYDQNGNRMNVDIVPESIKVEVSVTTPSKVVPIVVVPNGEIPNNRAISSISLTHSSVTISGPQSVLDTIDKIEIQLPVYDLTKDTNVVTMPINLPSGVRKKDPSVVSITVTLGDKIEKTFDDIQINYRNLGNWKATILENESPSVSVKVIGTKEMIDSIDPTSILAYIDFSEIGDDSNGIVEIPLHIEGDNKFVAYECNRLFIRVSVTK
ncbi:MAG: YbbR-like domain-containing protein [Traorella sp.]